MGLFSKHRKDLDVKKRQRNNSMIEIKVPTKIPKENNTISQSTLIESFLHFLKLSGNASNKRNSCTVDNIIKNNETLISQLDFQKVIQILMMENAFMGIPVIKESNLTLNQHLPTQEYGNFAEFRRGFLQNTKVSVKMVQSKSPFHSSTLILPELELLTEIRHPNLLLLMGITLLKDEAATVFEDISGGTLYQQLHVQNKKFSPDEVCLYMRQLAEVVNFLHEKGWIHTTITSHAVSITEHKILKLTGFELANCIHQKSYGNRDEILLRKQWYNWQAPEQLKEPASSCKRSDLFSVGLVLWEMYTGKKPWDKLSENDVKNCYMQSKSVLSSVESFPSGIKHVLDETLKVNFLLRNISLNQIIEILKGSQKLYESTIQEKGYKRSSGSITSCPNIQQTSEKQRSIAVVNPRSVQTINVQDKTKKVQVQEKTLGKSTLNKTVTPAVKVQKKSDSAENDEWDPYTGLRRVRKQIKLPEHRNFKDALIKNGEKTSQDMKVKKFEMPGRKDQPFNKSMRSSITSKKNTPSGDHVRDNCSQMTAAYKKPEITSNRNLKFGSGKPSQVERKLPVQNSSTKTYQPTPIKPASHQNQRVPSLNTVIKGTLTQNKPKNSGKQLPRTNNVLKTLQIQPTFEKTEVRRLSPESHVKELVRYIDRMVRRLGAIEQFDEIQIPNKMDEKFRLAYRKIVRGIQRVSECYPHLFSFHPPIILSDTSRYTCKKEFLKTVYLSPNTSLSESLLERERKSAGMLECSNVDTVVQTLSNINNYLPRNCDCLNDNLNKPGTNIKFSDNWQVMLNDGEKLDKFVSTPESPREDYMCKAGDVSLYLEDHYIDDELVNDQKLASHLQLLSSQDDILDFIFPPDEADDALLYEELRCKHETDNYKITFDSPNSNSDEDLPNNVDTLGTGVKCFSNNLRKESEHTNFFISLFKEKGNITKI